MQIKHGPGRQRDKKKKKGMIFTELTALFEWVDDETNDKYYIRI